MKISWMKRVSGIMLTILMLVDVISADCVYAQSADIGTAARESAALGEQVYVGDFNLYEYRAGVYLEDGTVCNNIINFMHGKYISFSCDNRSLKG